MNTAVIDWGIGGLSVYNAIKAREPHRKILYFSDSGNTPYGKMGRAELAARIIEIALAMQARGINEVVIACNAASTVLPDIEAKLEAQGIRITGVIARGIELVSRRKFKSVGIIGGKRTIQSKAYSLPLRTPKLKVIGRVAQPLSALIEKGELDSELLHKELKKILKPLLQVDAVVMACTHYPAIAAQIQKYLPDCELLDPAEQTAAFIAKAWKIPKQPRGNDLFFTTGSVGQMQKAARLAFGNELGSIQQIPVRFKRLP